MGYANCIIIRRCLYLYYPIVIDKPHWFNNLHMCQWPIQNEMNNCFTVTKFSIKRLINNMLVRLQLQKQL